MIGSALDRLIGVVSPSWGARRMHARATMSQIEAMTGAGEGYDAGKRNRLNPLRHNIDENSIPRSQVASLKARSWDLHRNNTSAKKVVRQILAKTIGKTVLPQSLATTTDGAPHNEFRKRVKKLWTRVASELDYRGAPSKGGQNFSGMARTGLRATILGGDILYRTIFLSEEEQRRRGLAIPLLVQLLDSDRLDERTEEFRGNHVIHGVEFNDDDTRAAYHLLNRSRRSRLVGDMTSLDTIRVTADQIGHVYIEEDIDQVRGVPWFAAALMQIRDTSDYQYNELMAAAMGACVVLGYRRPAGKGKLGLGGGGDGALADADGNPITRIQPGMLVDLGTDGELKGFSPNRPSNDAAEFIQHLLRSTAAGFPGVKGSTLTGDFRRSSFASERAADNEVWPEIEEIQHWYASVFFQPIYESVLDAAFLSGWFEGIVTPDEYSRRRHEFHLAEWQGPVMRSINPRDDAEASALEIKLGNSSPQIEAAKRGRNWLENLEDIKEFFDQVEQMGLPIEVALQAMGIQPLFGNGAVGLGNQENGEVDDERSSEAA